MSKQQIALFAACALIPVLVVGGYWTIKKTNFFSSHPTYGVIDLSAVVDGKRNEMEKMIMAGNLSPEKSKQLMASLASFGQRMESEVTAISADCNCVILARQAVLAGNVTDYTEELKKRLNK